MTRTMPRRLLALALLAIAPGRSGAQFTVVEPGSTVQGDFLRGEGIFLDGAGRHNYYSAVANSIDADTYIRLNEYVYRSFQAMEGERAKRVAASQKRNRENYQKMLAGKRENPDRKTLERGEALNFELDKLLSTELLRSYKLHYNPVPLSTADVRTIPFTYAREGAAISMRRLRDRKNWPVELRGEAYRVERRAYDRAIDAALEEICEGKLSKPAILRIDAAIRDLRSKLERESPLKENDFYSRANSHLLRLDRAKDQLHRPDIERIVRELDTYSGTTVEDLLTFMQRNDLKFGIAEPGDELQLYPRLYSSLVYQLKLAKESSQAQAEGR